GRCGGPSRSCATIDDRCSPPAEPLRPSCREPLALDKWFSPASSVSTGWLEVGGGSTRPVFEKPSVCLLAGSTPSSPEDNSASLPQPDSNFVHVSDLLARAPGPSSPLGPCSPRGASPICPEQSTGKIPETAADSLAQSRSSPR